MMSRGASSINMPLLTELSRCLITPKMPVFILTGISKEMGVSTGNSEEPRCDPSHASLLSNTHIE
jgi:hypothetical protein